MTVRINHELCNGCGRGEESLCMAVCPGNLLYKNTENKAVIRDSNDCWDCAACVKECPNQAIEMYLPVAIGGRGSTLTAKVLENKTLWELKKVNGEREIIEVRNYIDPS